MEPEIEDPAKATSLPGSGNLLDGGDRAADVAREFEGLIAATLQINSTQDLEAMCRQILEGARKVLSTQAASLMLSDEPGAGLKWFSALGPAGHRLVDLDLRPGEGIAGWVALAGESVMANDASADSRFCHRIDAFSGFQTRGLICVPLVIRGRILGVLEFLNRSDGAPFERHDLRKAQAFASLSAVALENSRLIRVAEEMGNVREIARFKAEMVSVVAHELRNPLTSIRGYSETLMTEETPDGDVVRIFSERIHQEAARMDRLIGDFLNLSRLESGQIPLRDQIVELGAVIQASIERFLARTTEHRLRLEAVAGAPMPATADLDMVTQVLDNLLSNAIKYSPDGGDVVVRCSRQGAAWRVAVQDQGLGIPPDCMSRLFHAFYRVPLPRHIRQKGTGLGLTIIKTLVERMGGRIGVESVPDQGTTFWFTLPAAEAAAAEEVRA